MKELLSMEKSVGEPRLTVVDMAVPNKSELAKTIRKACIESGFFYLINHGIDLDLLDEVFEQSKRFFDLPMEDKMTVLHDKNHRGYTPISEETLDPLNSKQGDTKEGYYIGWDVPNDDPMAVKPLHGPNQWPSKELLPEWRTTMEKYYMETLQLGHKVASLIALALDMDADFFKTMFTTPMVALRLLHYMADVSSPQDGKFASGAHSDYGLLTFLATDNNPGLQICREKDAVPRVWENVAPMRGYLNEISCLYSLLQIHQASFLAMLIAVMVNKTYVCGAYACWQIFRAFIVNLGDMLERWTNGLFRSTLHRVLSNGANRYSIPCFYEPNFDTVVECLPTCCSTTNPPKYPPITSGGHLVAKYTDTHSGYDAKAKQLVDSAVS